MSDVWCDDKLGYKDIGDAFTKLVKSIDTAHVISVEAGFGRGKTFFRTHWAQQLVAADELVVEIDLQQSDHTGDPVVTLLGALVAQVPPGDKARGKKVLETAAKIAGVGARTVARALLREGAEELIDATTAGAIEKLGDFDALDDVISGLGDGMSKAASQMIATQMAVEQVRTKELPDQLKALHEALTKGRENKRVIVILDELDRCHPDYAIAVLEAMKLVFHQDGFVFCLMVNAEYTENLAQHRFGKANDDERYLDKFVDLRLKLKPVEDALKAAVTEMAIELPLKIPFADGGEFSIDKAASLAGELAIQSGLGMRKIKRLLLKVELALRCYEKQPIDAPLLVFLAFQNDKPDSIKRIVCPGHSSLLNWQKSLCLSLMELRNEVTDESALSAYFIKKCERFLLNMKLFPKNDFELQMMQKTIMNGQTFSNTSPHTTSQTTKICWTQSPTSRTTDFKNLDPTYVTVL